MKKIIYITSSLIALTLLAGFKIIPDGVRNLLGDPNTYQISGSETYKQVLVDYINHISTILFGILGFVAVGFVIYGGFLYLTSAGNQAQMDKAKATLTYSIMGIIVILLAAFIVKLVIGFMN